MISVTSEPSRAQKNGYWFEADLNRAPPAVWRRKWLPTVGGEVAGTASASAGVLFDGAVVRYSTSQGREAADLETVKGWISRVNTAHAQGQS